MNIKTIKNIDLNGKKVLLRVDFNVPINKNGKIEDSTRIYAAIPTIEYLLNQDAKIIIMSHFGRPDGEPKKEFRLQIVAKELEQILEKKVLFVEDCIGEKVQNAVSAMHNSDIIVLENTRFYKEEELNDDEFSQKLAQNADVYVNDAFGAIHRAHASTVGVTKYLPSYAGLLLEKELTILSEAMDSPKKPFCLIVGGAKIDTKIGILNAFLNIADIFIIGGALANTFLAAQSFEVGSSLYEKNKIDTALQFLSDAKNKTVLLPVDAFCANEINENAESYVCDVNNVPSEAKILDIGPESVLKFSKAISESKTILWNGPMGLYELANFTDGTRSIIQAIKDSDSVKIVGGGDSIDAFNKLHFDEKDFTHVSTGGGAMLEFLESKNLPGVVPLLEQFSASSI